MSHFEPLVTIITVVLNGSRHLAQAMDSVLNQDYSKIEYIVIDGGSSDNTVSIIEEREGGLKYWVSESDYGIYDAMNKGLRKSSGDIIGILNCDDFYYSNSVISKVVSSASNVKAEIFHGDQISIYEHEGFTKYERLKPERNINKILERLVVFHPTVFMRRAVYNQIGGFDTRYRVIADYDLLLRAYLNGCTFHYIDAPLVGFRHGGASSKLSSVFENRRMIKERGLGSLRTWYLYSIDVLKAMLRAGRNKISPPEMRLRRQHLQEAMSNARIMR